MFWFASSSVVGLCIASPLKASLRSTVDVKRVCCVLRVAAGVHPLQDRLRGVAEYPMGCFDGQSFSGQLESDMLRSMLRMPELVQISDLQSLYIPFMMGMD
jgi:hypothetical protein